MKLYDVPRDTWVIPVEEVKTPPTAKEVSSGKPFLFKHIDGMYSYCKDSAGNIIHPAAWTEVKITELGLIDT